MSSGQKELVEGSGHEPKITSARRSKEDKAKDILPNIHISLDKQKSQKKKASKKMTIIKKDKGDKGDDAKETPRTDGEGSDVPDSARSQPADAGGSGVPPAGDALKNAPRSLPATADPASATGAPDGAKGQGSLAPGRGDVETGDAKDPASDGKAAAEAPPGGQDAKDREAPAEKKSARGRPFGRLLGAQAAPKEEPAGKKGAEDAARGGAESGSAEPGSALDAAKDRSVPREAAVTPGAAPEDKAAAPGESPGAKQGGKSPQNAAAGGISAQEPADKLPADKGASQGTRDLLTGVGTGAPQGEAGPKAGESKPSSVLESANKKVATVGTAASAAKALADIPAEKSAKNKDGGEAPQDAAAGASGLEGTDKGKEALGPKKSGRGLGKSFSALGRLWGGSGGKDGKGIGKKGDVIPEEDSAQPTVPVAAAPTPVATGPGAGSDSGAGKPGQGMPAMDKDDAPTAAPATVAAGGLGNGAPSKDGEPVGPEASPGEPGKDKTRGLEHRPRPLVPTADPDEDDDEEQTGDKANKGVFGKTLSGLGGLFRSKSRGATVSPVDKSKADDKGNRSSADRACPSDTKKAELPSDSKDQAKCAQTDPTGQGKHAVDGVPPEGPSKSIPTVMANKAPVALEVGGSEAGAAGGKGKAKKGGVPASLQNAGIAGVFGALGLAFFFFGKPGEPGEMLEPEAICDIPWTIKYGDQWMQNWLWHAE